MIYSPKRQNCDTPETVKVVVDWEKADNTSSVGKGCARCYRADGFRSMMVGNFSILAESIKGVGIIAHGPLS